MDTELVRRAQDGDREAFAALVPPAVERLLPWRSRSSATRTSLRKRRISRSSTRGRSSRRSASPTRFEAWLYRLVVNACRDEVRRRPWEVHASVPFDLAVDATEREQQVDDRDRLDRAFRRLSVDHRAVIVLHHHVGLPLVEVGRALGIPTGTIRSRLHYAMRAMRDARA